MGKINQILHCDWLLEQARWCHLARLGVPAESHNIIACLVKMAGMDIDLVPFFVRFKDLEFHLGP